jgi:hypothetical protein
LSQKVRDGVPKSLPRFASCPAQKRNSECQFGQTVATTARYVHSHVENEPERGEEWKVVPGAMFLRKQQLATERVIHAPFNRTDLQNAAGEHSSYTSATRLAKRHAEGKWKHDCAKKQNICRKLREHHCANTSKTAVGGEGQLCN